MYEKKVSPVGLIMVLGCVVLAGMLFYGCAVAPSGDSMKVGGFVGGLLVSIVAIYVAGRWLFVSVYVPKTIHSSRNDGPRIGKPIAPPALTQDETNKAAEDAIRQLQSRSGHKDEPI